MSDNFTDLPVPSPEIADQLAQAGIPEEMWPMLSQHGIGNLSQRMGIKFLELGPEKMVATMPVAGNEQVTGILHGGAHVVLAETLGSFAAGIHAGPGRTAVGVDINATHHRSVSSGLVTGTATAITLGRTLVSHEVVMRDEQGNRLSTARITNLIKDVR